MIKKGNQVKVIYGKDKGKTGEVIEIFHQNETRKGMLVHNQYLYLIEVANELIF